MKITKQHWMKFASISLMFIPLALGGAVLAWAISNRTSPEQQPINEIATPVSVMEVQQRDIEPRVVGYGLARPARTWTAVARVKGAIVETHPLLKSGNYIRQGEPLLRIDPVDYEIVLEQLTAEAAGIRAQISEVERTKANNQSTLAFERRSLEVARQEYERIRGLRMTNAVTDSEVDQAERTMLAQASVIQQLENSLALANPQIDRLKANLQLVEKRRRAAQLDLERTVIKAPFDCRLVDVDIEPGQYVSANEQLFHVHGIAATEVEARIPLDDLTILAGLPLEQPSPNATINAEASQSLDEIVRGLEATVLVKSGQWSRTWPAEIVRLRESIERRTRSVGIIVKVNHQVGTSNGPEAPLLEDMFCHVQLTGRTWPNQMLVPQSALRDDSVLVVDDRGRLEQRNVEWLFAQGTWACVRGEIAPGEQVVVRDTGIAVEGSLVRTVPTLNAVDTELARQEKPEDPARVSSLIEGPQQ